jgi:hypothetical protein
MKALTLYQPWATLVAIGAKRIETRSWSTNYRGPLAIHAGKNRRYVNNNGQECLTDLEPFHSYLEPYIGQELPRGCIVATCNLVAVKVTTNEIAFRQRRWSINGKFFYGAPDELAFGDFTPGRYMWFLDEIKILTEPIPAKGAMGLWEWDEAQP